MATLTLQSKLRAIKQLCTKTYEELNNEPEFDGGQAYFAKQILSILEAENQEQVDAILLW